MAEDKQLTVAELLARSRENKPDAEPPRRRRRRSLEEGGISVAELTGSFPAVEATPPESKHSSVPLDASPEDSDAERQAAEKAEAERKAEAEKKAAAEKAEAERKAEAGKKAAVEKAEAEKKAAADKAQAERKAEAEKKAAADKRAAEDRAILEEKARKEREAREAAAAVVKKPSADETTVLSKVTGQSKPEDSDTPSTAAATTVSKSSPKARATAADTTAIPTVKADAPRRREYGDTATIDAVRIDDNDERYADRQVERGHDGETEDWDDEGAGIATVIGMALVGVVIGVAVFIGFELMWGQLNSWFVTLLALAVTAVMVAVIRALRTGRDAAAMGLAAVVGLVMTFGPAILVL